MQGDKDYFEIYLDKYPDSPSLILVRSVEAKNFPISLIRHPVLDLCCGDGFFAYALSLKEISGCDISEHAINIAKEKGIYSNLKICDVRKMPFENDSFNTVISNCALEHVEGIETALLEVKRILNHKGILIMTVPNESLLELFPPKQFFERIGIFKLGKELLNIYNFKQVHRNICSYEEWAKLLNAIGFRIEQHFYLFDEKGYKVAITLDWLFTLDTFRFFYRFFRLVFPSQIRKVFWRKILYKYYKKSSPLTEGGELLIVARNEK